MRERHHRVEPTLSRRERRAGVRPDGSADPRLAFYRDPDRFHPHARRARPHHYLWHGWELDDRAWVLSDDLHEVAAAEGHRGTDFESTCKGHVKSSWATHDGSTVAWQGDQVNVRQAPNPHHKWRVWGDPHILNPDGSKEDFTRPNGLFEMPDGTRLVMIATGKKAVVHHVLVFPAGVTPSGFDGMLTTNYGLPVNGRFVDRGPVH